MKICMISPFPLELNRTIGGVEAVAAALVPALSSLAEVSEINVICFQLQRKSFSLQLTDKARVWYFEGQKRLDLPTRAVVDLLHAREFIRINPADVIHGQGIAFMGDIATMLSRHSVVSVHGIVHKEAKMKLSTGVADRARVALTTRMVQRVLKKAKVVISTSEYDRRELGALVRGQQVSIFNPVQPTFFQKTWQEASTPYFLLAGLMHPRKNIEGVLRAFKKTLERSPEAKLYICGPRVDDTYVDKIMRLISDLGIGHAINLLGLLDEADLAKVLRESAALILFSWEETSPTIIAQAMASCKPVIASTVGGIAELVQNGRSGYQISPGDEDGLADRMVELIQSQDLRRAMGECANKIAWKRFDARMVARETYQAYRLA